ncbi:MAG: GFA family protein [Hellea sp.]|nr:GFA family protein [Hellea sp.]
MTCLNGSCLCGNVTFEANGEAKRVSACYCGMCRKQNGGGAFHGAELKGELILTKDDGLKWYASSSKARRGFCADCGSSLFWQSNIDPSYFDVSLGALDDLSELKLEAHIFVDDKAPYQTVPNNAPHFTRSDVLANPLQDQ